MSEPIATRGVLVGHGGMAEGLVDAVRTIAGQDPAALVPLSNQGKAPQALSAEISALVGTAPAIIFTDMGSGSCAMAARLTCRSAGPRAVICGANLPMLLDFVFNREMPLDELVERLLDRGRRGIQRTPKSKTDADPTDSG